MKDITCYEILKDLVTFVGGALTLLVAGVAAWSAIGQWRDSNNEKRRELAWRKAAKGRELVDDLLKSNDGDEEYYAWDAMKMLDYQDAAPKSGKSRKPFETKKIRSKPYQVTSDTIRTALTPDDENEAEDEYLYVRECFDELYFKFGQLQDAIDNGLVNFEHVSCPADYYVKLMADDVELHFQYLMDWEYFRTLKFLKHFPSWEKAMREKIKRK